MSEYRYWRHRAGPRHVTTVSMMGTINAPQWEPVSVLTDAELASVERAAAERERSAIRSTIGAFQEHGVWAFDQAIKCIDKTRREEA